MELLEYRFTLDAHKNGVQRILQGFNTGDNRSRRLIISLTEAEESYDLPLDNIVAAMYVKRPSQTDPSINECTIDGNHIIYEVPASDLIEEGVVNYQLKLISGTVENPISVLVAPRFSAEVWESISDDSEAEDSPEYTALEAALVKAQMVYDARIIKFIFDKDIPEYDSTATYKIGDLVKNVGIYVCTEEIDEAEAWDSTKWSYKRDTTTPLYLTVVYGYDEVQQTHITYETDALMHVADEVYLSALKDVDIDEVSNGQALIYNATSEKWENSGVATAISNLEDVDLTNISDGQILIYNGTAQKWINDGVATSLSELSDVNLSSVSNGQKLSYDAIAQKWVNTDAVGSLEDLDNVQLTSLQNSQVIRYDFTLQKWVNAQGGYCDVVKISQSDYNNLSYDQIHDLTKIYAVYDAAGDTIDLGDLDDVDVVGVTNGQFLKYDSALGKWIPETSSATVASLSAIDDVSISSIQDGDTIQYDSTNEVWVNQPLNLDIVWGDIGGTLSDQTDLATALSAIPEELSDLSDVNISSLADGDTIVYDSTSQKFVNAPLPTSATWGNISGDIDDQSDLGSALSEKMDKDTPTGYGKFSLESTSSTDVINITTFNYTSDSDYSSGTYYYYLKFEAILDTPIDELLFMSYDFIDNSVSYTYHYYRGGSSVYSGASTFSFSKSDRVVVNGYVTKLLKKVRGTSTQSYRSYKGSGDDITSASLSLGTASTFEVDILGNVTASGNVVDGNGNILSNKLDRNLHTYTISAASWTTNSDSTTNTDYPYIYTVSVTGMTATDVPICQLFGSGTVTTQAEMADIALVQEIVSGSGTLTLYATDAPTNNLTLQTIGK